MPSNPATKRPEAAKVPDRLDTIGQQLRTAREAKSLSLRELARRLEISASALSQIETGKSRASVSTLYAIVRELDVSLDALFHGASPPGPEAPRRRSIPETTRSSQAESCVQRRETRAVIDLDSVVRWERLTPRSDPHADFLYVTYNVGGSSSDDHLMRHAGREYGLVLAGTLEVTVGSETYAVRAGDSISFDSTVPHRLRNAGSEPVHAIWLVVGRETDGGHAFT